MRPRLGIVPVLGIVLLLGVALRAQYAGVAPLIPRMQGEFELPFGPAGWLTAIPIMFLGIMAFAGPAFAGVAGTRAAITGSLLLVIVGSVLRAGAPDAMALLLTTLPVGIGIGLAGALISAAISKLDRALHGPALGFHALGLEVGTGGAAAVAAPLALLLGGWREALVVLTIPLLVALAAWSGGWRSDPSERLETSGAGRKSLRLPRASLALILIFGLQAVAFHSTATWLPTWLIEVGWSEAAAGAMLGVLNAVAIPGTILVAVWCRTFQARRLTTIGAALLLGAALALIALDPGRSLLWASAAGLAFGVLFPIAITLPLDHARDPTQALALSAGTLGFGYLLSSFGSALSGAFRDLSGSFMPVFAVLAACGPLIAIVAIRLRAAERSDVLVVGP